MQTLMHEPHRQAMGHFHPVQYIAEPTPNEYRTRMREGGPTSWGDRMEIISLSEITGHPIYVYTDENKPAYICRPDLTPGSNRKRKTLAPISILYQGKNQYSLITTTGTYEDIDTSKACPLIPNKAIGTGLGHLFPLTWEHGTSPLDREPGRETRIINRPSPPPARPARVNEDVEPSPHSPDTHLDDGELELKSDSEPEISTPVPPGAKYQSSRNNPPPEADTEMEQAVIASLELNQPPANHQPLRDTLPPEDDPEMEQAMMASLELNHPPTAEAIRALSTDPDYRNCMMTSMTPGHPYWCQVCHDPHTRADSVCQICRTRVHSTRHGNGTNPCSTSPGDPCSSAHVRCIPCADKIKAQTRAELEGKVQTWISHGYVPPHDPLYDFDTAETARAIKASLANSGGPSQGGTNDRELEEAIQASLVEPALLITPRPKGQEYDKQNRTQGTHPVDPPVPTRLDKMKAAQQRMKESFSLKITAGIKTFSKIYETGDDPLTLTTLPEHLGIETALDEFRSQGRPAAVASRKRTFIMANEYAIKHGKPTTHWHPPRAKKTKTSSATSQTKGQCYTDPITVDDLPGPQDTQLHGRTPWPGNNTLSPDELAQVRREIISGGYLSDTAIYGAMLVIRRRFPDAGGMRDTVYQYRTDRLYDHRPGFQVIFVEPNHWVCCYMQQPGTYLIMDSLNGGESHPVTCAIQVIHSSTPSHGTAPASPPDISYPAVTEQEGVDCAIHAIANGTSCLLGIHPSSVKWDQSDKMRAHLLHKWFDDAGNDQAPMFPHTVINNTRLPMGNHEPAPSPQTRNATTGNTKEGNMVSPPPETQITDGETTPMMDPPMSANPLLTHSPPGDSDTPRIATTPMHPGDEGSTPPYTVTNSTHSPADNHEAHLLSQNHTANTAKKRNRSTPPGTQDATDETTPVLDPPMILISLPADNPPRSDDIPRDANTRMHQHDGSIQTKKRGKNTRRPKSRDKNNNTTGTTNEEEPPLPNKTRFARPKHERGKHTWKGLQVQPAGPGRGNGLFSTSTDILGLLIPILGDRITDGMLTTLENRGQASHTWSFSRTTHIKQFVTGAINGLATNPADPISGLYIAMMINEPKYGEAPNCLFKDGHILVARNPGKGNELTIWYGDNPQAHAQRTVSGYMVDPQTCRPDFGNWEKILPSYLSMSEDLNKWLQICPHATGTLDERRSKQTSITQWLSILPPTPRDTPTIDMCPICEMQPSAPKCLTCGFKSCTDILCTDSHGQCETHTHYYSDGSMHDHGDQLTNDDEPCSESWPNTERNTTAATHPQPTEVESQPAVPSLHTAPTVRMWISMCTNRNTVCIAVSTPPRDAFGDTDSYTPSSYDTMSGDSIRNRAFDRAISHIASTVTGDCDVIEIGPGMHALISRMISTHIKGRNHGVNLIMVETPLAAGGLAVTHARRQTKVHKGRVLEGYSTDPHICAEITRLATRNARIFAAEIIGNFFSSEAYPYIFAEACLQGIVKHDTITIPAQGATIWRPSDYTKIPIRKGTPVIWAEKIIYTSPTALSGPPGTIPPQYLSKHWGLMEFYDFYNQSNKNAITQKTQDTTSTVTILADGELNSISFAIWAHLGHSTDRAGKEQDTLVMDTPDLLLRVGHKSGGAHFNSAHGHDQCARNWLTPTIILEPEEQVSKNDTVTVRSVTDATGSAPSYTFHVRLEHGTNVVREWKVSLSYNDIRPTLADTGYPIPGAPGQTKQCTVPPETPTGKAQRTASSTTPNAEQHPYATTTQDNTDHAASQGTSGLPPVTPRGPPNPQYKPQLSVTDPMTRNGQHTENEPTPGPRDETLDKRERKAKRKRERENKMSPATTNPHDKPKKNDRATKGRKKHKVNDATRHTTHPPECSQCTKPQGPIIACSLCAQPACTGMNSTCMPAYLEWQGEPDNCNQATFILKTSKGPHNPHSQGGQPTHCAHICAHCLSSDTSKNHEDLIDGVARNLTNPHANVTFAPTTIPPLNQNEEGKRNGHKGMKGKKHKHEPKHQKDSKNHKHNSKPRKQRPPDWATKELSNKSCSACPSGPHMQKKLARTAECCKCRRFFCAETDSQCLPGYLSWEGKYQKHRTTITLGLRKMGSPMDLLDRKGNMVGHLHICAECMPPPQETQQQNPPQASQTDSESGTNPEQLHPQKETTHAQPISNQPPQPDTAPSRDGEEGHKPPTTPPHEPPTHIENKLGNRTRSRATTLEGAVWGNEKHRGYLYDSTDNNMGPIYIGEALWMDKYLPDGTLAHRRGIFAGRDYVPHEPLTPYAGITRYAKKGEVTNEEMEYFRTLFSGEGCVIDGNREPWEGFGLGQLANDRRGKIPPNAAFVVRDCFEPNAWRKNRAMGIYLQAISPIEKGDEITISYGKWFFQKYGMEKKRRNDQQDETGPDNKKRVRHRTETKTDPTPIPTPPNNHTPTTQPHQHNPPLPLTISQPHPHLHTPHLGPEEGIEIDQVTTARTDQEHKTAGPKRRAMDQPSPRPPLKTRRLTPPPPAPDQEHKTAAPKRRTADLPSPRPPLKTRRLTPPPRAPDHEMHVTPGEAEPTPPDSTCIQYTSNNGA